MSARFRAWCDRKTVPFVLIYCPFVAPANPYAWCTNSSNASTELTKKMKERERECTCCQKTRPFCRCGAQIQAVTIAAIIAFQCATAAAADNKRADGIFYLNILFVIFVLEGYICFSRNPTSFVICLSMFCSRYCHTMTNDNNNDDAISVVDGA